MSFYKTMKWASQAPVIGPIPTKNPLPTSQPGTAEKTTKRTGMDIIGEFVMVRRPDGKMIFFTEEGLYLEK